MSLFKLKLVRADQAMGSIPTITEKDMLSDPKFGRKTLDQVVNDIKVQYARRVSPAIEIVSMSADWDVWIITLSDGRTYTWGDDSLGNGTNDDADPTVLLEGNHGFVYTGASWGHVWGLDAEGRTWGWAGGTYAEIGNGSCYVWCDKPNTWYYWPTEAGSYPGEFTFTQVDKGGWHALGLTADGKIYGWGYSYGGNPMQSETGMGPVKTLPGGYLSQYPEQEYLEKTDWVQVFCGWNTSHAIDSSGRLWATGSNGCSMIGLPDRYDNHVTVFTQVGTDTDWVKVRSGDCFVVAQKSNGDLYGFGYDNWGALGLGYAPGYLYTPTKMDISDVDDFYCDGYSTSVLKTDGTIWSTGDNGGGQLGIGNYDDKLVFTQVIGGHTFTKICDLGYESAMAATADGKVYAWGWYRGTTEPGDWLDHTPNLIKFNFIDGMAF